jgi:hypothetical protein
MNIPQLTAYSISDETTDELSALENLLKNCKRKISYSRISSWWH